MRERYGVSDQPNGGRGTAYRDNGSNYYEGQDNWRTPSVDPIGGRNLRGGTRGGNAPTPPVANIPFLIVLGIVIILLIAVIALALGRCSSGSASVESQATQSTETVDGSQSGQSGSSTDSSQTAAGSVSGSASGSAGTATTPSSSSQTVTDAERTALLKVLDEDVADKLINRTVTSDDVKWIAQNPDAYAMDGEAVQRKLLKLAADEPAAQQYVRDFPEKYPMATPQNGKVSTVVTGRGIPRLYQWDELWGYTVYSGTAFGLTGCCPTCLAMVYQGITGLTDYSPYDMGEIAVQEGYATENEGTIASFLIDAAKELDLPVSEIDVTKKALKNALQSNQVVIVNFAPGIFTEYGHYVVITGLNQDGTVIMNDPYSEERSNQNWDMDTIVEESQGFYAYG